MLFTYVASIEWSNHWFSKAIYIVIISSFDSHAVLISSVNHIPTTHSNSKVLLL
ncbi:hypothetical protein [Stygiolobus sp. CP8521M]|uniref:hypothetical protein n=1 Tax=Stygiolobus sp. CP8521M TaxID=3133136 RepID=UPI00307E5427